MSLNVLRHSDASPAQAAGPVSLAGAVAEALREQFPARTVPDTWPASRISREEIIKRVSDRAFRTARPETVMSRARGANRILQWLETFPGETWQQRWRACPTTSRPDRWEDEIRSWVLKSGYQTSLGDLKAGTLSLICADVVRPELLWLTGRSSRFLRDAVAETRDPEGFARLESAIEPDLWSSRVGSLARIQISMIIIAKGGRIRDITVGDCLELIETQLQERIRTGKRGDLSLFYTWLHGQGIFPPDAPTTLRSFRQHAGQHSVSRLVDRYQLRCQPVRDLIVDYLAERQPKLDYASLEDLSRTLASRFWADLERHHPGIDSLELAPEVAAAWKERLRTKVTRVRRPDGTSVDVTSTREGAVDLLMHVRAFYLDLAQWAAEEPARWGPWAVRCPIAQTEIDLKKRDKQQKARMDQRTRERLPVLPALVRAANRRLKEAKARLEAAQAAPASACFTVLGETYTKATGTSFDDPNRTTTVYDAQGVRIELSKSENRAFWAWASIEFLRHTGARIEEMLETSHHSIVQYKLPTTGEVVPLLQIAPSKTDEERLLLVTPELADVLSAIVSRVRDSTGRIPLVASYDLGEKIMNPPMPLLFQWKIGGHNRPVSTNTIRRSLHETLESTGLTDGAGNPLYYQPHDFRRIFVTDAILNGMPAHIAQVICGHKNINTTMGYNTVYPAKVIEAHRAFIARRRSLRPGEEYRTPTAEEWDSFLGHFERRKLSLGVCGRAYGTDCIHEHACIRCSLLRVDPNERPRLEEIRDNLMDRIVEAEREGWLGEIEILETSLAAAKEKIAQIDAEKARTSTVVHLGLPTFSQIVCRSTDAREPQA
ncbi:tyrosine-type recombinase/integrase [Kitasatospora sp. NPDC059408]|uniref:tyrosine-type recombinase/integrase n=1 Tax=Kitasatospora sp. NPDC059408 TaxID=3346823 RepID=UPI0036CE6C2D